MATALPREELGFNVALTVYKVCSFLHLRSSTGLKHYNLLVFISFIIQLTTVPAIDVPERLLIRQNCTAGSGERCVQISFKGL